MNKKLNLYTGLSQLMLLLLLCSCSSNPDSPGSEYMPDMYRSPAVESYVDYGEIRGRENMEIKTQLSARQTPKYTVPYYGTNESEVKMMLPNKRKAGLAWRESHGLFGWDLDTESAYDKARLDTINPLTMTPENAETILENGEKLYTSMCAHCHGEKGDGNGTMIQSGAYGDMGVVPDYKALDTLSEGKIYYSIYYGKGYMGAHGSLLNKKEIWTLVHYVRQFQRDGYGKFDKVGKVEESDKSEESK